MKKLIEVSLPLEAINVASAREKSIRHGHPSTLHLWWARRPLAACRAVLFSSLVDDPSEYMPDEESARIERERLFDIIEDLVIWENSNNEEVLDKAKIEIARSVARNLNVDVPVGKEAVREFLATKAPPVLDPFAGGGSIPLEAQRLGLRAYASDLNPVAVLINKALIEIPPKFANMPPVHPIEESPVQKGKGKKGEATMPLWQKEWKGAQGLAEDVRYYGKWMRDEAFKRIGHLYPPVTITKEMLAERPDLIKQGLKAGDQLTVIAWLWARTVKCPNPACGAKMPLASSLLLSKKKSIYLQPQINKTTKPPQINFILKIGNQEGGEELKTGRGAQFRCAACRQVASEESVREQFVSKKSGVHPLAIVAESRNKRVYLSFNDYIDFLKVTPKWTPEESMNKDTRDLVSGRGYGFTYWHELFTKRQLVLLTTLSDLVGEAYELILKDLQKGDQQNKEYAIAVSTYLGLGVSKLSDYNSSFVLWSPTRDQAKGTFARQALPMVWDFSEINPFARAAGDLETSLDGMADVLETLNSVSSGFVSQENAMQISKNLSVMTSTDPPYYDNISYADLSDYFYVWLRCSLNQFYPQVFATMLVPKSQELVASSYRFDGNKEKAEVFFEQGLRKVFTNLNTISVKGYPTTVYYAFKQSEDDNSEDEISIASTGWETMLDGLLKSGFQISGTWPIRTERGARTISIGTNALASSIVLVCRPRPEDAISCSRREFLSALKRELAPALRELQQGSIAPVDLAQASIGPGMAVYSRYSAVLEADGKSMSVRTALTLINQALDEYLTEQEGEYDGDTRWALTWFEQYGHNEAAYGVAETLSRAKNTSVDGLNEAGIVEARGGKVRLIRRDELNTEWDPTQDKRLTAWESAAHLIYALENGGEESAAELLAKLGPVAEVARDLAYRLYTVCERKGWTQDALGYNMLVVAWPRLKELAARRVEPGQGKLL